MSHDIKGIVQFCSDQLLAQEEILSGTSMQPIVSEPLLNLTLAVKLIFKEKRTDQSPFRSIAILSYSQMGHWTLLAI